MDRTEQTMSDAVASMMKAQMGREMYNHNVYKSYSNFFFVRGNIKMAKYYEERANEEYNHHNWFFDRLNQSGVELEYPAVEALKKQHQITTPEAAFTNTVALEIETTNEINAIVKQCISEGDYQNEHWLKEVLLEEQTEEETISRLIRDMAESKSDWLSKGSTILEFYEDREYATSEDREIINECKCKKK